MKRISLALAVGAVGLIGLAIAPASAQNVKVTPLGSHDGEFCRNDRAMVFEDPDGTRILYDAGRTVRGPDDERLGNIDAVLLSHVHGDHLGDARGSGANAGECGSPDLSVKTVPQSNTIDIVVAKKAKLLIGGEMNSFLTSKVTKAGGDRSQVLLIRAGGSRKVGGVTVSTVPAVHSNGVDVAFLEGDIAQQMKANGLTAYVGPPNGYVLQFSNGLSVYLSGDTGMIAEQDSVVNRYYKAKLTVMNIGGIFSTGPMEAAWVINELVKPNSVIASHANEVATKGGKVVEGSKTDTFIKAVKVSGYASLSGQTMEFDADGKCVAGC
jgi:L-ascorbate metabolism protein UlaG (beta-lactamase superfamily)